jgi:hypothetical protein
MKTRNQRRALARDTQRQAQAWPLHLVSVPMSDWPEARPEVERPIALWRSRHYLAMLYAAPAFVGIEVRRLTVNRVTLGRDGHYEQGIPWEDLQRCKRETGHGDWYAVEVYPRERDLVHVANMRHLWLLAAPLGIGWFRAMASDPAPSVAFGVARAREPVGEV